MLSQTAVPPGAGSIRPLLPRGSQAGATDAQSQRALWPGVWFPALGSLSLAWSCPARPLWEGMLCHCPAGVVLDFSSVWGRSWSLRPISSADWGQLPPNTPAFREKSLVGPRGGSSDPAGTWPTATLVLQSLHGPSIPEGQASGQSSSRAAVQPCPWRVRAQRSGPAPGHWAGPECQASPPARQPGVHPRGSRPACWSRQHPGGLGRPSSSLICDARGGLVPSLLIPWHEPHLNPPAPCAAPLAHPHACSAAFHS